jgi:hypothetical protein
MRPYHSGRISNGGFGFLSKNSDEPSKRAVPEKTADSSFLSVSHRAKACRLVQQYSFTTIVKGLPGDDWR